MFLKQLSTEEIIENREELSTDDIDSSGRFTMWKWSLKNFYEGKELQGSGLGVLQAVFYSGSHPFGAIRIIHNDYIQILCDTGIIGLILYGLIMVALFFHSFHSFLKKNQVQVVRIAALISGVSLAGILSTLYTDNVVNYTLMTLSYPFGIYGMFLGLNKKYSAENL
jgi:O-antigen ligase